MMWWNGEPLPTPSPGISFEERIVEGTNSGQTLGGSYSKKIIARKEDVRVTWEGLTAEESAVIGKLAKLINVKSIVTLVLTGVFSYLAITGKIAVDNFTDMFQIIMIFYFGTQSGKAEASASKSE